MTTDQTYQRSLDSNSNPTSDMLSRSSQNIWKEIGNDLQDINRNLRELNQRQSSSPATASDTNAPAGANSSTAADSSGGQWLDCGSVSSLYGADSAPASCATTGGDQTASTASTGSDQTASTAATGGDQTASSAATGGDQTASTASTSSDQTASTAATGGDQTASTASTGGDQTASTAATGGDQSSNSCDQSNSSCDQSNSSSSDQSNSSGDQSSNSSDQSSSSGDPVMQDLVRLLSDLESGNTQALSSDLNCLIQDMSAEYGVNSGSQDSSSSSSSGDSASTPSDGSSAATPTAGSGNSASGDGSTNDGSTPADSTAAADGAAPIATNDMLAMQDNSNNTVVPGLNVVSRGFGWANGATKETSIPDAANLEVPWMTAFPIDGQNVDANAQLTVNNMNSYALLKDGSWHKLSTANNSNNWGEINPPDFTAKQNLPITENADGSLTVGAPPTGSVDQFGAGGGNFDRSQLVGFYESAQVKANSDNSGLAVQLGGDVYSTDANSGGQPIGGNYYLTGWGTSNWVALNSQYQTVALSNIDPATLASNPPPGVSG